MDTLSILDEILALIEAKGVKLRKVPMGGDGGGLCSLKGHNAYFLDTQGDSMEQAVKAAKALKKLADTDTMFLKPAIRLFIDQYGT